MNSKAEIFFSYAWGDKQEAGDSREKIVNALYQSLSNDSFQVIRDKYNLEYKGFISDFMKRIGKGKCIIIAISQKYVKSPYCMFELYEIARNSNFDKTQFRDKVIPVMVEFVDFTSPAVIEDHLLYWENEYKKWEELIKKRAGQVSVEQMQRYDKIKMIYQNFGKLTEWIIDMNTLTPQLLSVDNFAEIKKAIIEKGGISQPPEIKIATQVLKMPAIWILIVITLAGMVFITSKLSSKWNNLPTQSVNAYTLVSSAGEQLLIVQDTNTKRFGYARAKDTSLFISCKYDKANPFKDRIALVKIEGKYQFIRPDSSAFQESYDYAEEFLQRKAKVVMGKDTFYINNKGEKVPESLVNITKGQIKDPSAKPLQIVDPNTDGNKQVDNIVTQPVITCRAICYTNGIIGVEVSFFDSKNNKYSKVSDGNDLAFDVPCPLVDAYVKVTFRANGQIEARNVKLKGFEIPEMFKTNL